MPDDSWGRSPYGRPSFNASVLSMMHLEPSPMMESSPAASIIDEKEEEEEEEEETKSLAESRYSRRSLGGTSTSTLGLHDSSRGTIFWLTRVQKYSSYAMSLFTSLHLANVSLIPASTGSVDASEAYLLMTREIYQTTLAEPFLVILPFFAHIGSGIALRLVRRTENVRRYGRVSPWPELSWISTSGYAFTLFYSAHVAMNRLLPLAVEGDSSNIGLAYVAHVFARHPAVAKIAYGGLIGVGASHMVWGAARWLGLAPSTRGWLQPRHSKNQSVIVDRKTRRERRRKWFGVQGVALGVAAAWAIGGIGVVSRGGASEGWVGNTYDALFTRVGLQ